MQTYPIIDMKSSTFEWAIIGAGPAGIAAIGKLLDQNIHPKKILWVDPAFNVGDLGKYWRNVSSNTKVKLFQSFLLACQSFAYREIEHQFELSELDIEKTCSLAKIVEPLQTITHHLCQSVQIIQANVQEITLSTSCWHLQINNQTVESKRVILATGSVPKVLNYPEIPTIPLPVAIDKQLLAKSIHQEDTIAVFGASHSAVIILDHLVDLKVKKIINFYRTPCRYALDMGDWILFDNTGLKGQSATWAKQYLDGQLPDNLKRYPATENNIAHFLPSCQQSIYAIGFTPRSHIVINGYENLTYNPHVGILAPGLFGLGIAYPELKMDPMGHCEYQVGLWKFMTYLNKVLPIWQRYTA